jgi:peroxiredoxin
MIGLLRYSRVVALAAVMAVVLLAACDGTGSDPSFGMIDYPEDPGNVGAQPGQHAPNFRLETAGGGEVVLAGELGTPIRLNFFASWCTNCRQEMKAFDEVAGENVRVIGIDYQEAEGTVLKLADETGATFPMGLDRSGKVSREYRATSLPVTLLIDEDGVVLEYFRGPVDEEQLAELLSPLRSMEEQR